MMPIGQGVKTDPSVKRPKAAPPRAPPKLAHVRMRPPHDGGSPCDDDLRRPLEDEIKTVAMCRKEAAVANKQ